MSRPMRRAGQMMSEKETSEMLFRSDVLSPLGMIRLLPEHISGKTPFMK